MYSQITIINLSVDNRLEPTTLRPYPSLTLSNYTKAAESNICHYTALIRVDQGYT